MLASQFVIHIHVPTSQNAFRCSQTPPCTSGLSFISHPSKYSLTAPHVTPGVNKTEDEVGFSWVVICRWFILCKPFINIVNTMPVAKLVLCYVHLHLK